MSGGSLGHAAIPLFGCACLLVILVLQIVSFASPHWASQDDNTDFGLWRYSHCATTTFGTRIKCNSYIRSTVFGDWMYAVRGLESLAIIFWSIPLIVVPVYLYVSLGLYYQCMMLCMTIFTFVATVCNIAGVIIFGVNLNDTPEWDWEWCFILAAIAGGIGFINFIIFLIAFFNRPVFGMQTHLTSGFYVEPDRNRMYVIENTDEKPGPLEEGIVNPALSE